MTYPSIGPEKIEAKLVAVCSTRGQHLSRSCYRVVIACHYQKSEKNKKVIPQKNKGPTQTDGKEDNFLENLKG